MRILTACASILASCWVAWRLFHSVSHAKGICALRVPSGPLHAHMLSNCNSGLLPLPLQVRQPLLSQAAGQRRQGHVRRLLPPLLHRAPGVCKGVPALACACLLLAHQHTRYHAVRHAPSTRTETSMCADQAQAGCFTCCLLRSCPHFNAPCLHVRAWSSCMCMPILIPPLLKFACACAFRTHADQAHASGVAAASAVGHHPVHPGPQISRALPLPHPRWAMCICW